MASRCRGAVPSWTPCPGGAGVRHQQHLQQADVLPAVPPMPPAILGTVTQPWGAVCVFLELKQPLHLQGPQVPKILRDDRIRVLSFFLKRRSLIPSCCQHQLGELLGVLTASACEGWGGLKEVEGGSQEIQDMRWNHSMSLSGELPPIFLQVGKGDPMHTCLVSPSSSSASEELLTS